MIISHQIISHS